MNLTPLFTTARNVFRQIISFQSSLLAESAGVMYEVVGFPSGIRPDFFTAGFESPLVCSRYVTTTDGLF